jgi:TldD protein
MTHGKKEPDSIFHDRFGLTRHELDCILSNALAGGGDFAELYLEYRTRDMLALEEGMLKSATKGIYQGLGVRVLAGDKTGYASADSLNLEEMLAAAALAGAIAREPGPRLPPRLAHHRSMHNLYPVPLPMTDSGLAAKLQLLQEADRTARAYDPKVAEVRVVLANETKHILVYGGEAEPVCDLQPLTVFQVSCIAVRNGERQIGIKGGGGRVGLDYFAVKPAASFAERAARQAVLLLDATPAPAGPMPVVLGPGWPGILLHEAVGHGLEADFNRKKLSAFAGRIGQRVASDLCTVVDDGTIPGRRGSLNVDDEGNATGRTLLIEKGILRGYMQDALSARLMRTAPTGNGRRESYAFAPMPRMTNTFMEAGASTPEEVIRSVDRGLYAVDFGGGQVDITNGKFVFSASEAYLIEGGRVTAPVRGATLIGNGPEILTRVTMVGNDLCLDEGLGNCSKDGQSVAVSVGTPTLKISEITVGGVRG